MIKKIYMYKRFERFWHWAQALLIFSGADRVESMVHTKFSIQCRRCTCTPGSCSLYS